MKATLKKRVNKIVVILSLFFSYSCIFFAGSFSSDYKEESLAAYISSVSKNDTINGDCCALGVRPSDKTVQNRDSYNEFNSTYGLFGERKTYFAPIINMYDGEKRDKEHQINIVENNTTMSDNLSFLNVGPIGTLKKENLIRHYIYPIETMFEDTIKKYDSLPTGYLAYISQEHADKLLYYYGETKQRDGAFSIEQYRSLIIDSKRQIFNLRVDDNIYPFAIQNIYLKSGYYYETINSTFGDFVLTSYYLPSNLRVEQNNCYFFRNNDYQNKYFMRYINNNYDYDKFTIKVNRFNIIGEIDENYITSFYYFGFKNSHEWISITLFFVSILGVCCTLIFSMKNKYHIKKYFSVINLTIPLFVYLIFFIIFKISNSIIFFTHLSCFIFLIVLICAYFIIYFVKMLASDKKVLKKESALYEINI